MELTPSEETRIWVNKSYRTHIPTIFTYALSILLLILWNEMELPLQVTIVLNLVYRLSSIPYIYSTLKQYPTEKPLAFSLASDILFLLLLIPVSLNKFDLIFAGIPLFLQNILVSFFDYKNSLNFNLFSHFICNMLNWCKSLIIFCISLKLNKNIEWDWIYIFWPFWITSGLALLISLAYLATFIAFGCKNLKKSIGQLWAIGSLIIYSMGCILLIIGFCSLFHYDSSVFSICYGIAASGILVHLSVTLILKKFIVNFIVDFFIQNQEKKSEHSIKKVFRTVKKTFQIFKINSTLYTFDKRETKAEKSLKDSVKDCVICCENECDSVFMPCGHAGVCNTCALKLLESTKLCHICRKHIEKVLKMIKDDDKVIVITEMDNE